MRITRRQFLGFMGAFGLASCARVEKYTRRVGLGGDEAFSFAAVGDTHLLDARRTGIVIRAMAQINADTRVQFTVFLGDITSSGELAEFRLAKACFDRLTKPYYTLPGNHDVFMHSRNIYANYEQTFGQRQWVQEYAWVLLGLDSTDRDKSDVAIQPDRIEWLRKHLKKIGPKRPIALLCHHPFNPSCKQYRVTNADEVLALFSGHNLKLVASGHYHGNQVETQNGILFTTTACCSSSRPNFDNSDAKGYRLFHIKGDQIETEFVQVPA